MNAIALLIKDHETVQSLFEEFRAASESGDETRQQELQRQICDELATHTRIEEDIFYPAVRDLHDDELHEMVAESVQEHHVVKLLLREIADVRTSEVLVAKMTVLMENVEHHVEEEEDEMFPQVESHFDDERLEALGAEMEAAKG